MNRESSYTWPESTKKALVSNKNIILYYAYLENLFSKSEKKIHLSKLLFKDRHEKNFLLNRNEWCTLEEYVSFVEKACTLTNNFELPKIVGALLPKYLKQYKLQEFKDEVFNNLKVFF